MWCNFHFLYVGLFAPIVTFVYACTESADMTCPLYVFVVDDVDDLVSVNVCVDLQCPRITSEDIIDEQSFAATSDLPTAVGPANTITSGR